MTFGEKIKYLRNEREWTQEYVAKKLNISAPALSRYESGTCEPKDLELVSQFAVLYDVSTDFLLGLIDKDNTTINENDFHVGLSKSEEVTLTEEEKEEIKNFAKFVMSKRHENK